MRSVIIAQRKRSIFGFESESNLRGRVTEKRGRWQQQIQKKRRKRLQETRYLQILSSLLDDSEALVQPRKRVQNSHICKASSTEEYIVTRFVELEFAYNELAGFVQRNSRKSERKAERSATPCCTRVLSARLCHPIVTVLLCKTRSLSVNGLNSLGGIEMPVKS